MTELFLKIVNMSISASWLVLAVLVIRLLLRKAPKWVNVLLWGIAAVRLVCPFSVESILSLIPSRETISPEIMVQAAPTIQTGIPVINSAVNPVISQTFAPDPAASANPLQIWIPILAGIWVLGMALMLLYTAVSYWRLRRRVKEAVLLRDNIYQSEHTASPFVLGILRPRIYLPYHMSEQDLRHVVAHEQAHIRRKDHWWKPLGFLLLTIHWFNPILWVAYVLLCRDIELACDEKVIRELGTDQRADYSQALLSCSVDRRRIAACPLAFGEVGVKERVKAVLHYKKPAFWIILIAVIACIALAVCFLTDPREKEDASRYEGKMLSVEIVDSSGTERYEPKWNYFEIRRFDGVTLPGANTADFSVTEIGEDAVTITFGSALVLVQENREVREIRLTPEESIELVTPTPGGCTYYTFSIVPAEDADPGVSGEDVDSVQMEVKQWFDYYRKPEAWPENTSREIQIPEIPGAVFRWSGEEITVTDDSGTRQVIRGMPVLSGYFADLNGDGVPELCATLNFGSGLIDTQICVYDHAAGETYTLEDRGYYDYGLSLKDGVLTVTQTEYATENVAAEGTLAMIQDPNTKELRLTFVTGEVWPVMVNPGGGELTLEDVLALSEKGMDLTWEDLAPYSGRDIGSGLFVVRFEISSAFYLLVGDGKTTGTPMYAMLRVENSDDWIDIRTEDVEAFIRDHGEALREDAISSAILAHFKSDDPDGLIHVESHVILDSRQVSGTPLINGGEPVTEETVYLLVLHQAYSYDFYYGKGLEAVKGCYVPTAITFTVYDGLEYAVKEYWEPRDGSYNDDDIREKFPKAAAEEALGGQQTYVDDLTAQCQRKAMAILEAQGIYADDPAALLDEICSGPGVSSNPGDYINAHREAYDRLTGYGEHTLRYCFEKFLEGDQVGLQGHIMAAACEDIMAGWGEAYLIEPADRVTGQDWFNSFLSLAREQDRQYSDLDLEKLYPGAYLVQQMQKG